MTVAIVLHRADGAPVATPFRRTAFGTDDPFVEHREIAWEGPDSMIVGRTSFVGELEVASFPHIETIVVVEGELILTAAGAAPAGARSASGCCHRMRHHASHPGRISRAVFVLRGRLRQTDEARPCPVARRRRLQAVCIATGRGLAWPGPAMPSDNVFSSDGADYRAGTWDSTPYHRVVRPHRQNEFMHLLAGSVRFAAPDGSVLSAGTGDALFVPQGASIGWESNDRVAKFFVVQSVQA
ncbi:cupin domain-containing protein [Mesorhizobium sp. M0138]|uniref:cupin domain-containing protein n=1 Tax=Mesorhizobium sp. M0138 TaxID=2956891 RepID=UPI00333A19EC